MTLFDKVLKSFVLISSPPLPSLPLSLPHPHPELWDTVPGIVSPTSLVIQFSSLETLKASQFGNERLASSLPLSVLLCGGDG